MTWLRDLDDDLINLDHVQKIEVAALEVPQEHETHCVTARFATGDDTIIFLGVEADCIAHRDKIMLKLPMVRF